LRALCGDGAGAEAGFLVDDGAKEFGIDALLLCRAIDERRGYRIGQRIARGFFGFECRTRFGNGIAPGFQARAYGLGLRLGGGTLLGHSGALLFGGRLGEGGRGQKEDDPLHNLQIGRIGLDFSLILRRSLAALSFVRLRRVGSAGCLVPVLIDLHFEPSVVGIGQILKKALGKYLLKRREHE